MSDDGFEEFTDDDGSQDSRGSRASRSDSGAADLDFFGESNKQYMATTVESPFEIPYSNMKDLGKRKPKKEIKDELIALPKTDTDVNIGMPERSDDDDFGQMSNDEGSDKEERENEGKGDGGGLNDFMKSFLKRGQEDARSPSKDTLKREAQTKFGVPDIAPPKVQKSVHEHYHEQLAKYANTSGALNGIMEDDEFEDNEDPLVALGLAKKKTKKKNKDKSIGLTSAVQAQKIALEKEKEKLETPFV